MTISNEAVEKAAIALMVVTPDVWARQATWVKDRYRWDAQVALEAAAPIIRADVLEAAADDINSGSCDENYAPEACETCRAVEMLRERAVAERGGE